MPPIFYWHPRWNKDVNRYEARFFLPLAKLPSRPEKTVLRASMALKDSRVRPPKNLTEATHLVFTVRKPKQIVRFPDVSKDPLLGIVKAEVAKSNAADQKTNGGFDTSVELRFEDLGPPDAVGSTSGGDSVVDEKGNPVGGGARWSTSSSSGSSSDGSQHHVLLFDLKLSTVPKSQKNVFAHLKFSRGDRWPLIVRVPVRRNGKDLSGVVQALPEKP